MLYLWGQQNPLGPGVNSSGRIRSTSGSTTWYINLAANLMTLTIIYISMSLILINFQEGVSDPTKSTSIPDLHVEVHIIFDSSH